MTHDFAIPEALAGLGQPLEIHPPKAGAGRAGYFTTGGICAILSGLSATGLANPPANNPPPPEMFLGLTCVLGALALGLICMGLLSRSYTLILFPEGLARTGGEAPEIFRWSDVREVYSYAHPIAPKHWIVAQDGRKLEIDVRVKDGKKLGQAVEKTMLDRMLPRAVAAFDSGETLSFGALRVDQIYLYYKDKRVAWSELAKMTLLYNAYTRSIQFEVKAAGSGLLPWCVVQAQNIPNLNVFKMLVERKRAFSR